MQRTGFVELCGSALFIGFSFCSLSVCFKVSEKMPIETSPSQNKKCQLWKSMGTNKIFQIVLRNFLT